MTPQSVFNWSQTLHSQFPSWSACCGNCQKKTHTINALAAGWFMGFLNQFVPASSLPAPPLPATVTASQLSPLLEVDKDSFAVDHLIRSSSTADGGSLTQTYILIRGSLRRAEIFSCSSISEQGAAPDVSRSISLLMEDLRSQQQSRNSSFHGQAAQHCELSSIKSRLTSLKLLWWHFRKKMSSHSVIKLDSWMSLAWNYAKPKV